ncbi:opioid growth factor receptor-related protein [Vreelandella neptunia]|uniref:Opioid growth factor receptor-related protein n=1 Tax=Vreelandella neptunia TaxID=115551 RepID=A0ABZ0YKJ0_9GAMM|nr:opioid growth factor receptor-related protein [Halomonas neptunia]MDN3562094.1 opioid growth factor receptor-related protein [Halomonas neptunia]WQH11797.1 opioid growth factor receptor-related protein [Halomonas neptunia]
MGNDERLIAFYRGEGHDHKGRRLEDIWVLPSFWLEHTHDYIQWLFPIPEMGRFNAFAPLLTSEVQAAFEREASLRQRQQHSLDVMLDFFGLERENYVITAQPNLSIQTHIWLKAGGHNHLRITRMIRSLFLCHQPELAQAFQQSVIDIGTQHGIVSEKSLNYWRDAI